MLILIAFANAFHALQILIAFGNAFHALQSLKVSTFMLGFSTCESYLAILWFSLTIMVFDSNVHLLSVYVFCYLPLSFDFFLTLVILLLAGPTETRKQQKSWGCVHGHCHINWFTWHNNGISHEEKLSIFEIQSFTTCLILKFFFCS